MHRSRLSEWYVIGIDLNGQRCRTARVYIPGGITEPQHALRYIRNMARDGAFGPYYPYAAATEVEKA